MHAIVRGRVSRNADYHSQMADYYAGFQNEGRSAKEPPTPPLGEGNGKRARGATPPPKPTQLCPYNDEQLVKLVEMHTGAAEQLNAILANEKPQLILAERVATPKRKTGVPSSLRIH